MLGILSLALSLIVGIIGLILGLVAWSMGDTAIKKLNAANIYDGSERNNASIGRICGIITSALFLGRLLLIFLLGQR